MVEISNEPFTQEDNTKQQVDKIMYMLYLNQSNINIMKAVYSTPEMYNIINKYNNPSKMPDKSVLFIYVILFVIILLILCILNSL